MLLNLNDNNLTAVLLVLYYGNWPSLWGLDVVGNILRSEDCTVRLKREVDNDSILLQHHKDICKNILARAAGFALSEISRFTCHDANVMVQGSIYVCTKNDLHVGPAYVSGMFCDVVDAGGTPGTVVHKWYLNGCT